MSWSWKFVSCCWKFVSSTSYVKKKPQKNKLTNKQTNKQTNKKTPNMSFMTKHITIYLIMCIICCESSCMYMYNFLLVEWFVFLLFQNRSSIKNIKSRIWMIYLGQIWIKTLTFFVIFLPIINKKFISQWTISQVM